MSLILDDINVKINFLWFEIYFFLWDARRHGFANTQCMHNRNFLNQKMRLKVRDDSDREFFRKVSLIAHAATLKFNSRHSWN